MSSNAAVAVRQAAVVQEFVCPSFGTSGSNRVVSLAGESSLSVIKNVGLLFCLILLGGCSAQSMIVRTYDGPPLDSGQVASILVPEDINLVSVDGRPQKDYLLDNLDLTYEVTPGPHRLVYRYSSIWSKPAATKEDSKVDVIESSLRELIYDFKAGVRYELAFARPEDREKARLFAEGFSAYLVTSEGQRVMSDSDYRGEPVAPGVATSDGATSGLATPGVAAGAIVGGAAVAGVAAGSTASSAAVAGASGTLQPTSGLSRLEGLKTLWSDATPEEKKEFLRWAFQ